MSEEMEIDGKSYISSKKASVISGYAQDYIGQLARKSLIEARRIGGLWYISMESLDSYKQKAAEFKPEPPTRINTPEAGSLVFFDGKEYLSASGAAEQTGYTQDYVGQLARAGTVLSRQVGNRWYVERQAIFEHKKEKDALLAAVQAESVGLTRQSPVKKGHEKYLANTSLSGSNELLTYFNEESDLIPDMHQVSSEVKGDELAIETVPEQVAIPIKRIQEIKTQYRGSVLPPRPQRSRGQASKYSSMPLLLAAVATIVIVVSVGYASVLKQNSVYAVSIDKDGAMGAVALSAANAFDWVGNTLEPLLTHELIYERQSNN